MNGPWIRPDGSRYWLDEPREVQPTPEPLVAVPETPEPPQPAPEPWRPSGATAEPIVAFGRDVLGLKLWPAQAALLSEVYADNIRTCVLRLGRRSGKGRMASVLATYEATVNAA